MILNKGNFDKDTVTGKEAEGQGMYFGLEEGSFDNGKVMISIANN